jgi:hypothetical protein
MDVALLLLFVDRGITFQVLDFGRRLGLECVSEKIGSGNLIKAYLGYESRLFLVTRVIAEYVDRQRQSSVEILLLNLSCAEG